MIVSYYSEWRKDCAQEKLWRVKKEVDRTTGAFVMNYLTFAEDYFKRIDNRSRKRREHVGLMSKYHVTKNGKPQQRHYEANWVWYQGSFGQMDAFCHNGDVLVEFQDAKEFHCCQKDDQGQEQTLDVSPQTDEIKAHSRIGILA